MSDYELKKCERIVIVLEYYLHRCTLPRPTSGSKPQAHPSPSDCWTGGTPCGDKENCMQMR